MTTSTTRIIVTPGRRSVYVQIGLAILALDAVLALPLVFMAGKLLGSL